MSTGCQRYCPRDNFLYQAVDEYEIGVHSACGLDGGKAGAYESGGHAGPQNAADLHCKYCQHASGAKQEDVDQTAGAVIQQQCLGCHNGSNPHLPVLNTYNDVAKAAEVDTGMGLFTLVRVSHIHLFGITFIFFLTSQIFCHAFVRQVWMKCVVLALPFIAILIDIGSWYLTKLWPPFAIVVMGSGVLMGLSFAVQWITSIWQMWFYRVPDEVNDQEGALPCLGQSCERPATTR